MLYEQISDPNKSEHNDIKRRFAGSLSRRRFLIASAATVGVGLLAACGGDDDEPPAQGGTKTTPAAGAATQPAKPVNRTGMLVSGFDSDPVDLTPHRYQGAASLTFKGCVYDALLAFNPQGEIVPHLAERFEWAQPTTLEFKLRQGVKFHNGSPLTSQDVKASFENIMTGDTAAFLKDSLSQTISTIETPDDFTVRLVLKTTSAALLAQLAMPDTPVILPKDLLAQGNDFTKQPVGSGPFMYDRTEPGAFIMLKKNPNYWLPDQPNVDELKLLILTQPSARADAVISGLTHIGETPPVIDFPRLDERKDIKSVYQTNFMACIFFNLNHKPFADVKVREAISWAIDRQAILDAAYQGEGRTITGGVLHEPWFCQDLEGTFGKRDLDKARSLLKEAGFESGFKATMMASNTPSQQLPAEVVRDNLKDLNIDVALDIIPFSETVGRQSRGDYHFRIQGTSYRLPDPDGFSLMFPSGHGYWAAGAGWQDAELDDLIQRGRAEMDLEKRKQIACETQAALLKKIPWIFMAYGKGSSMAVRTDMVEGYHTDDWKGLVSLYAVQWHLRRLSLKA